VLVSKVEITHQFTFSSKLDMSPNIIEKYNLDPDGNYVELQVDNWDAEARGSTAFMHTPEFLANPVGVPISPDSNVEAWRQGTTLQGLHERSWAGEFVAGAPPVFDMPANT
jgi:hypothetical protein